MKKQKYNFVMAVLVMIISACSSNTDSNQKQAEKEEVTYQEVVQTVYADEGERIEWHGEAIDQTAISSVTLYLNGPCEKKDCGEKFFVRNNDTTNSITIVVNSKFLIPDQDLSHARKYTLSPGSEQFVGCSEFCHELESFKIANEIVGAKFL